MIKQFTVVSSLVLLVGAQLVSGNPDGVIVIGDERLAGGTGEDYKFQCQQTLQSGDAPTLEWEFNENTIINGSKYSIHDDKDQPASSTTSTLTIKNAQLEDAGEYFCHGQDRSSTTKFELALTPSVTVTITDEGGKFILAVGTRIGCVVEGMEGDNSVEWFKEETKLKKGKQDLNGDKADDVELTDDNVLEFLSEDSSILAGEYTCKYFKNQTGVFEFSAVQVIGTDIDIDVPKSIKVSEGEDGDIICKATSIPKAEITFYHEGKLIDGSEDKYDIRPKQALNENEVIRVLTIKDVQLGDAQSPNFTCTVSNNATEKSEVVLLRIRDKLAALWPFIGIVSEVIILIVIILIHEACTKGEDIGEVDDDEEDHLLQKDRTITRDGERETRMRGTNN